MTDYIKREDAINAYNQRIVRYGLADFESVLNQIPAADVRENVRGKWVTSKIDPDFVTCSQCKITKNQNAMAWKKSYLKGVKRTFAFCPVCGAHMRGEKDDGKTGD